MRGKEEESKGSSAMARRRKGRRPCATPMNAEQRVLRSGVYSPRIAFLFLRASRSFFATIRPPGPIPLHPGQAGCATGRHAVECVAHPTPVGRGPERVCDAALDTGAALCYNGGRLGGPRQSRHGPRAEHRSTT